MKINTIDQQISFIVTGPESSGKTTLLQLLDDFYEFPIEWEYARQWLTKNGPEYNFKDLIHMEKIQRENHELKLQEFASKYFLIDTDLLNYIVWAEDKFDKLPDEWLDRWIKMENRHYLLCMPDIPWEADPLREDQGRRAYIFERHLYYLENYNKSFCLISGDKSERFEKAQIFIRGIIYKSYF